MEIMFGSNWILHDKLKALLAAMQVEEVWYGLKQRDVCSLIWDIHVGIQMALAQKNVQWIQRVIDDFTTGRVPDWTEFRQCVKAQLPTEESAGMPRLHKSVGHRCEGTNARRLAQLVWEFLSAREVPC